jgi:membrane-associated phospholipid phosphatase
MTTRGSSVIAALAFHAILLPGPASAQLDSVPPAATTPLHPSSRVITRHVAAVAGVLLAGSILADYEVREEMQEHRSGTTNSFARVGNTFGDWRLILPALSAGYVAGEIAGNSELKGTMLRAGAAVALATGITSGLKYSIGRDRPHVASGSFQFRPFSGSNSFPSGHTAAAFAIATALADRTTDGWSDYVLYGAATLTAIARLNDDRHWTSDVLIGGLVGHLSARWVTKQMGPVRVAPAGVELRIQF